MKTLDTIDLSHLATVCGGASSSDQSPGPQAEEDKLWGRVHRQVIAAHGYDPEHMSAEQGLKAMNEADCKVWGTNCY